MPNKLQRPMTLNNHSFKLGQQLGANTEPFNSAGPLYGWKILPRWICSAKDRSWGSIRQRAFDENCQHILAIWRMLPPLSKRHVSWRCPPPEDWLSHSHCLTQPLTCERGTQSLILLSWNLIVYLLLLVTKVVEGTFYYFITYRTECLTS